MNINQINENDYLRFCVSGNNLSISSIPKNESSAIDELVSSLGCKRLTLESTGDTSEVSNQMVKSEVEELSEVLCKYAPKGTNAFKDGKVMYNAAAAGDEKAVRLLIKYKVDQGVDRSKILGLAIFSKSLSLVKYLVESESYVSGYELLNSICCDFFDGFDYFRSRGYEIPKDIIVKSIYGSNMSRVNFLISRGADLSCIKESPWVLSFAINADDMELMKFLLQNHAQEKMADLDWASGVYCCAFQGGVLRLGFERKIEYIRLLADSGARINEKYPYSYMIWKEISKMVSVGDRESKIEMIKSLVNAGLSVNQEIPKNFDSPSSYQTSLQYVMRNFNNAELIELMLQMGANPNYISHNEETNLQTAINIGDKKIIGLLINYGANLSSL